MSCLTSYRRVNLSIAWFWVAVCLIVGALYGSERLHYFSFNNDKGWTALIAIATTGSAVLLTFVWIVVAICFRMPCRFTVRTLFMPTIAVALSCSWLGIEMKKAHEQERAVLAIEKSGGRVSLDAKHHNMISNAPTWLLNFLGQHYFAEVDLVELGATASENGAIEYLGSLSGLKCLDIHDGKITDADLKQIKCLTQLKYLSLCRIDVTDAGLECIEGLSQLDALWLEHTKITDAGLKHIAGLHQLRTLNLSGNDITGAGLEHIKKLGQLKSLGLSHTKITDAGLEYLSRALPQIETLWLDYTAITDAGLNRIKDPSLLRGLVLSGNNVTDAGLEYLKNMPQLETLMVNSTRVSGAGADTLHKTLPTCHILMSHGGRW